MRATLLPFLLLIGVTSQSGGPGPSADWPHYGGGPEQMRYSPLTQITPANVALAEGRLDLRHRRRVRGLRDAVPARRGARRAVRDLAQAARLRARRRHRAVKWSFDPLEGEKTPTRTRIRGLMYWERGDERRIYFAARHWLYALDARTGKPLASFGADGRIDLRQGFRGRDPRALSVGVNTPGVFYGDLLILGSVVPEGLPSAPGDIRAFDVHTGAQKWAFHTIPHPGELGYDTWPKDAWKYTGGANAWAGLSLDAKRGLVFAATGSAAYDFYGANRHGDNLFANTILCLRAATGERVWHFQAVKHDVWDRDFPAPPALITIARDGRRRDVVAQIAQERPHLRSRPRDRRAGLSDGGGARRRLRRAGRAARRRRRCCRRCRRRSRGRGSPRTSSPRGRRPPSRPCARSG